MFTAALLIIAKIWKQPKCPMMDEWIKMWHIYARARTHEYYSVIKNPVICDNVNEPWSYYAKWNKSDGERQISYDFIHMWNQNKTNEQTK